MAAISLRGLTKRFGQTEVIKGVDIEIADGEFCVFVGPSGCGKSTLLRMIAGLEDITGGDLSIGGRRMNDLPPKDRGVAMVFQSYAIFPHMTVRENVAFGLTIAGAPAAEKAEKVAKAARILQMEHLLDRRPSQLSGGQRQRVAIGRAIVREPAVFLFDEPLSNLDAALRMDMRMEIGKLHRQLGATMVYVTHDQVEAMTLADKIVVLRDGLVQQAGSPMELYHNPANLFVAGFLGAPAMNFLPVTVQAAAAESVTVAADGLAPVVVSARRGPFTVGQQALLGLRPQYLDISAAPGRAILQGTAVLAERLGSETVLEIVQPSGQRIIAALPRDLQIAPGASVSLGFEPGQAHLFHPSDSAPGAAH